MDFSLVTTPSGFGDAARTLADGVGPFAIDTERASTYRYDDRAFVVQIYRRGAGTFLICPEGYRDAVSLAFSPVLNGTDWILHAAGEDLPSLNALGLNPGNLFDTELASRLTGFDHPNLGAMVATFTGVELEKGHGREDWSQHPLPAEWQMYAALDVLYLNELAEGLTELLDAQGKLEAAEDEFDYLAHRQHPQPKTWRDLKGLSRVPEGMGLQVAKSLWLRRDKLARTRDISPSRVLNSKVIIEIARQLPQTPGQLSRISGFPARRKGAVEQWFTVLSSAYQVAPNAWPSKPERSGEPGKSAWQRHYPDSWEQLVAAREALRDLATDLSMTPEVVLQPALLRSVVWQCRDRTCDTDHIARVLLAAGARRWQVDATAPLIARALRAPSS